MLVVEKVQVRVKRADIRHGEPQSCGNCPIARGIRRAVPDASDIAVTAGMIKFTLPGGKRVKVHTPCVAADFIALLDTYGASSVDPISFPLTFCSEAA